MHTILHFFLKLFECLLLLCILAGGIFSYWYYIEYQPRVLLKSYCHDANCACFHNLVDYRFSNTQIKSFSRYLESLELRPETQLLEFTTLDEVKNILSILQICQPKRVQKQEVIQSDELNQTDSSLPNVTENDLTQGG